MRKGEVALKVLETLGRAAADAATLLEVILSSPYGASLSRLKAEKRRIEKKGVRNNYGLQDRQRFYDLLYRLHKDGLIEKKIKDKKKVWHLTPEGKQETEQLKRYLAAKPPKRNYQRASEQELKIVAFDVPEKYGHKRFWLRMALKNLGFVMLQKSVWVGKNKLPQEFFEDVHKLGLLPYLEILAVTKTGSLKEITR